MFFFSLEENFPQCKEKLWKTNEKKSENCFVFLAFCGIILNV